MIISIFACQAAYCWTYLWVKLFVVYLECHLQGRSQDFRNTEVNGTKRDVTKFHFFLHSYMVLRLNFPAWSKCCFKTSPHHKNNISVRKWQNDVLSIQIWIYFLKSYQGHDLSVFHHGSDRCCIHTAHWDPAYRVRISRTRSQVPLWTFGYFGFGWDQRK